MFVPAACLKCGKMFQAPAAAAGTEVACPWCQEATPILPVAGLPIQSPQPLSLDDDEPAEPPRREPQRRSWLATIALGLLLVAAVLAATLAILRYGSGSIPDAGWQEFTPPDGSCSIALPDAPSEEHLDAAPGDSIARGGQQYSTSGWYSKSRVWFGWRDLDPAWVKQAVLDRDGAITSPVLAAERDRRKREANGSIEREARVRFGPNTGLEVEMDSPKGKRVERYLLDLAGPRPRLYFMGIQAKNVSAKSPAVQRLFDSFRVNH